jgi:hypothetical protein
LAPDAAPAESQQPARIAIMPLVPVAVRE